MQKNEIRAKLVAMLDEGNKEVITILNNYLFDTKDFNSVVGFNDEDFWNMTYLTPADAVKAMVSGDVNMSHPYINFDGCGHPKTWNFATLKDEIISCYLDEIVDWLNVKYNWLFIAFNFEHKGE